MNKWMERLAKLEGAVLQHNNIYSDVIRSPSPSFNYIFGNSHGLPKGYTTALYGVTKGGKSLLTNLIIGQLHKDDPEAIVVKFNTEFRENAQTTPRMLTKAGIDLNRYMPYETNSPELIFDRIEKDIKKSCQDGAPIKLIVIDSITDIMGRRSLGTDTIMTQNIGDHALTIGEGLKRILPVQRKHNIGLILVTQARADLDQQYGYGPKIKPEAGFAVQHFCEYFVYVEQDRSKEGRADLLDREFEDINLKDSQGNIEKVAFKVKATMKDSSLGPKGRVGIFTYHRYDGIINIHEEVFLLGINRGLIQRPNNRTYIVGDKELDGKKSTLEFLKDNPEIQEYIIKEIKKMDMTSYYADQ